MRQVFPLGHPWHRAAVSLMGCQPWGRRLYDSVCLVGQVILIVEDEEGPFAQQLQAALERVGAETMLACTLVVHVIMPVASIFSIAAIYADGVVRTVEFRRLLKELGRMPVLLYGTEPPPYGWFRNA